MRAVVLLFAAAASTAAFRVTREAECKAYLCKYGYTFRLNCACPPTAGDTSILPSARWPLQRVAPTGSAWPRCTTRQFAEALAAFQKIYGLAVTGTCDERTMLAMSSPRCGVVDDFAANDRAVSSGPAAGDDRSDDAIGGRRSTRPRDDRDDAVNEAAVVSREKRSAAVTAVVGRAKRSATVAAAVGRAKRSAMVAAAVGRAKRSTTVVGSTTNPWVNRKGPIRWRIVRYSNRLKAADQDSTMEEAFRKWAAVTPLCFVKDVSSDIRNVDVLISFLQGMHAGDFRIFDGYGGEIAHSYPGRFTHFDAQESWVIGNAGTSTGYYLLPAAIHEFGHLLGLSHSPNSTSVMNSLYSDRRSLSDEDIAAAAAIYGRCSGKFDAVLDVVFSQKEIDDHGMYRTRRYYSTMFFRNSVNWLYKNSIGRPLEGEPRQISSMFSGLPNSLDVLVQHSKRRSDGSYADTLIAIKGSHVYVYDYQDRRVLSTATISAFFPSGSSGQTLPNNLDSGYYDPRDGNIYFFKDNMVYAYRFDPDGPHSCCEFVRPIADVYPPGQAAGAPTLAESNRVPPYARNVDATYLSIESDSLYFFKDDQVWVTTDVKAGSQLSNYMIPMGQWNQYWSYICETDC